MPAITAWSRISRYTINDTGTGNTLNLSKARVIQMVADSLRYWATSFGSMDSASTSG
jgi:pullulanase/glycogen debranching enzyme